jgi:hypothetical protein
MSDYVRTSLVFPITEGTTGQALGRLGDELESRLRPEQLKFHFLVESSTKFVDLEPDGIPAPPANRCVDLGRTSRSVVGLGQLALAGQSFEARLYVFSVDPQRCWVRLSLHSYLTHELRGTKDFGGAVKIHTGLKRDLIGMALALAKSLGVPGFVFGLEPEACLPFGLPELESALRRPLHAKIPLAMYFAGIDDRVVRRKELVAAWGPDATIVQSSTFNIVDLLHDREALVEDDKDPDDEEGDLG